MSITWLRGGEKQVVVGVGAGQESEAFVTFLSLVKTSQNLTSV